MEKDHPKGAPQSPAHLTHGLDTLAHPKIVELSESSQNYLKAIMNIPEHCREGDAGDIYRVGSMELVKGQHGLLLGDPSAPYHPTVGSQDYLSPKFSELFKQHGNEAKQLLMETLHLNGQLAYLEANADAFINHDWRLVIDVDIYAQRSAFAGVMHRDTLGHTMFFNLNFCNYQEIVGPEYILNPPVVQGHLDAIKKTMPARFIEHLCLQYAKLPAPCEIQSTRIPPYGAVSMVDELAYHATPWFSHRDKYISFSDIKTHWRQALVNTYGDAMGVQYDSKKTCSREQAKELPRIVLATEDLCRRVDATKIDQGSLDQVIPYAADFVENLFKLCPLQNPFVMAGIPSVGDQKGVNTPLPTGLKRQLSGELERKEAPLPGAYQSRSFLRSWVMAVPNTPAK